MECVYAFGKSYSKVSKFKFLAVCSLLMMFVRQASGVAADAPSSAVMDALREKKNNFRG